jgi:hypothetical protein
MHDGLPGMSAWVVRSRSKISERVRRDDFRRDIAALAVIGVSFGSVLNFEPRLRATAFSVAALIR